MDVISEIRRLSVRPYSLRAFKITSSTDCSQNNFF